MILLFRQKIIRQYAFCLLIALLSTSCKKFIDISAPENQIEAVEVFKDDQSAISAMTGLYNRMLASNLFIANGGTTLYSSLSADELYNTSATSSSDVFYKNSIPPNNNLVQGNLWIPAYKTIYHANAILEGIEKSDRLTEPVRKQLAGEALLIRSLQFFYLLNLFGDVPLITTTDYEVNRIMPRTPVPEIYQQITNDLLEAKNLLSTSYPTTGRVRANKLAATSLLARIYLYQRQWALAEAQASEVINSGAYALQNDLNSVFFSNSTETIWQFANDNNNTAEGIALLPSSGTARPAFAITPHLLNAFEAGDQRKTKWLKANTVSGQTFYYAFKYKVRASTPVTEYYIALRLAEQFLIRAEARAQMDNLPAALQDLNTIRNRSGLPPVAAGDKATALLAIEKERQTELFCEWGHRWLDLKRTGKADSYLGVIKSPNWQSTDTLFPIPFAQIQTNPFLTQNPGY